MSFTFVAGDQLVGSTAPDPDNGSGQKKRRARTRSHRPQIRIPWPILLPTGSADHQIRILKHTIARLQMRLAELGEPEPPPPPSLGDILDAVVEHTGVSRVALMSPRHHRATVRARMVVMYLAHKLTPASLPEIGRWLNHRDHTTVLHAVWRTDELRLKDPALDELIEALTAKLQA